VGGRAVQPEGPGFLSRLSWHDIAESDDLALVWEREVAVDMGVGDAAGADDSDPEHVGPLHQPAASIDFCTSAMKPAAASAGVVRSNSTSCMYRSSTASTSEAPFGTMAGASPRKGTRDS